MENDLGALADELLERLNTPAGVAPKPLGRERRGHIPAQCPNVTRERRHQGLREEIMRSENGICHLCGEGGADAIDHIVPVAWGGSDDYMNLSPAHTSCNSSKGAERPSEWTLGWPEMWIDGYGARTESTRKPRGVSARTIVLWFWAVFLAFVVVCGAILVAGIKVIGWLAPAPRRTPSWRMPDKR